MLQIEKRPPLAGWRLLGDRRTITQEIGQKDVELPPVQEASAHAYGAVPREAS